MIKRKVLNGKPYAGNPHVWFEDGGEVAPAAMPRSGSLLYKRLKMLAAAAAIATAMFAPLGAWADTHTVAGGDEVSLSNISETDRFVKDGEGTLVLGGNNTLKRMTMKAGVLKFAGGATTIRDAVTGGAGDNNVVFAQSGGTIIVEGGAEVGVSTEAGTHYALSHGGDLLVTNGVFDASGVGSYLHAFMDNGATSANRLVISGNGRFKASSIRVTTNKNAGYADDMGIFLDCGGILEIGQFTMSNYDTLYGQISYNGGLVIPTVAQRLYASMNKGWTNVKSYVREGGFHLSNEVGRVTLDRTLFNGAAADGGIHLYSTSGKVVAMRAANTQNGGLHLHGNVTLDITADDYFGALPDDPEENIFADGESVKIFGGPFTVHRNRGISVANGTTLRLGTYADGFRICGEIRAPLSDGCNFNTNSVLEAPETWLYRTVIDTGAGRTNTFGRLRVHSTLEFASGVSILGSPDAYANSDADALVSVQGNGNSYSAQGNLLVSGGTLSGNQPNRHFVTTKYAQVAITNGLVEILGSDSSYMNGLWSPGTLTVEGSGTLAVNSLRVTQSGTAPSVININTGGVIRTANLYYDTSTTSIGEINFNGGRLQSLTDKYNLVNSYTDGKWTNVVCSVREGGAVFDLSSEHHLFWTLPLVSGAENDGGLTVTGPAGCTKCAVLMTTNFYNGITRVEHGSLQVRKDYGLPPGSTLRLENGSSATFYTYDIAPAQTQTTQTLARLEGDGTVYSCSYLHVTDSIAPDAGGVLEFETACDLRGTFEIAGDASSCGRIRVQRGSQDISNIVLSGVNLNDLDGKVPAGRYIILDAPDGYSGRFALSGEWPPTWKVVYTRTGAYIRRIKGIVMVVE